MRLFTSILLGFAIQLSASTTEIVLDDIFSALDLKTPKTVFIMNQEQLYYDIMKEHQDEDQVSVIYLDRGIEKLDVIADELCFEEIAHFSLGKNTLEEVLDILKSQPTFQPKIICMDVSFLNKDEEIKKVLDLGYLPVEMTEEQIVLIHRAYSKIIKVASY